MALLVAKIPDLYALCRFVMAALCDCKFSLHSRSLTKLGNYTEGYYSLLLCSWLSPWPLFFSLAFGTLDVTAVDVSTGKTHREMQFFLHSLPSCVGCITGFSLSIDN